MITIQQAVSLTYRTTLYHATQKDNTGAPVKCRVNGKCKTWKTRPTDFSLPVKHGLHLCFRITPANADQWRIDI